MNVCDIVNAVKVRYAVERYCERKVLEQLMQVAACFHRDGRLVLSNNVSFNAKKSKNLLINFALVIDLY